MLFDKIYEGFYIFHLGEDRSCLDVVSAAFSVIYSGVFLHELTAVDLSVGHEKDGSGRFMYEESQLFNVETEGSSQLSQIV